MSEPSDAFSSLLRSDLSTSTDTFLSVYHEGISRSSNPLDALTRFTVGPMAINKDDVTILAHKLLSIKVDDNQSNNEYDYDFFIERNGTQPQGLPASAEFLVPTLASVSIASTSAAGSSAVVSTVAVQSMANLNFQSSQQTATPSEVHPLLPLNETSSTPDSNSSVSPTPTPSISRHYPSIQSNASPSQLSVSEKVTMASTRALHSVSESLTSVAEDRILGQGNFVTDGQGRDARVAVREIGRIVSQIWPNELSFYELGLLVDVVHKESPDYHILKGQCYWFKRHTQFISTFM